MKKFLISKLIIVLLLSIFYLDTSAIPAFARKYKTSCNTCHSTFPKLNPFGEAFRINGFQFPEDELGKIKEEPVIIGAEAYKLAWPNAIWPSTIPLTSPISLRGRTAFEVMPQGENVIAEFGPPALQLIAAGTMGEDITLFVGAHLFEANEPGSIDRFYLKFDNMFTKFLPKHLLYIRIGQFIPELVPFASNHRGLTQTAYAFNTYGPELGSSFMAGHVHGGGPFGIENFQLGTEASGVIAKRIRYVAGVVNGGGTHEDINSARDFYGRLAIKFGGMAYDGSIKEGKEADLETSLAIGVFGYNGTNTNASTAEDYKFYRSGFDINAYYKKLNLVGGLIMGTEGETDSNKYNLFFVEANYMFYPWLTGLIRYEQANPENLDSVSRIVPHISALVVANVKFRIESRLDPADLKFDNLYLGLDFAF